MSCQPSPLAALRILDEQFLVVRSKLIDLAATLDRLDRAAADENGPHSLDTDPRIKKIGEALQRLLQAGPGRAEDIQIIFSLSYDQ